MALSKIERALLKNARTLIATQQERYICLALATAAMSAGYRLISAGRRAEAEETHAAGERLRHYIANALDGYSSLDAWYVTHSLPSTAAALRAARLAWIDWMLGE